MHLEEYGKEIEIIKILIITNTKKYTNNNSQTVNAPWRKIYDWLISLSESAF